MSLEIREYKIFFGSGQWILYGWNIVYVNGILEGKLEKQKVGKE